VFGYGAAQALRRASPKLAGRDYSHLVFSILVGDDFKRDRFSYYYGFPKPALVHTDNGIAWSAVSDPNVPGTKYHPSHNKFFPLVYGRSQMLAATVDRFFPDYDVLGDRLTTVHPSAADRNKIVDWTLREFSRFKIKNKVLLLQYASPDNTTEIDVAEEKKLILKIADELSLKVVDTSTVLENYKKSELWYMYGHHTPFGNELVCLYLFDRF
jgi:hypothetical protein